MATVAGTIKSVSLIENSATLSGNGAERSAIVVADFGAYTGASDNGQLTALDTAISGRVRNGKTITLRGLQCVAPGKDTNNQLVYSSVGTVSGSNITFDLTAVNRTTELTTATASTGVCFHVVYSES